MEYLTMNKYRALRLVLPSQTWRRTCITVFATVLLWAAQSRAQNDDITLYRYTNDQGVKVINSSIPAKYAQGGYEIINTNGEVLKRVAAAPTKEDIDKANEERAILDEYAILKRRYSGLGDIERAKQRRLSDIKTSISILNGTIQNLELNITNLVQRAADLERAGRPVHDSLLNQLKDTRAELEISQDLLNYRQSEYKETAQKYDQEIRAFIRGEKLKNSLENTEE